MNPPCAKCTKTVYPVESLKCLDQVWHKGCFRCETCSMMLNMKNYKGYDKRPYCSAHYPTTKFTAVAETPENLRLKQQSQIQSQVQYHKDFEESKGKYTAVADDPETLRLLELRQNISLVNYHKDFEESKGKYTVIADDAEILRQQHLQKFTSSVEYHKDFETQKGSKISTAMDPETERILKNSQISSQATYAGIREQRQEQERRRSEIDYDAEQDSHQHPSQQQYRRQPGKIADYDPVYHANVQKDNTPYSSRGQTRVVYTNSESTEFGTLIGFQKVPDSGTLGRKSSYGDGVDDVQMRRHGPGDADRRSERVSDHQSTYSAQSEEEEKKPLFVPYVPEPVPEKPKQPEMTKFRVNTGFEKLKLENGKVEGNNNRLSVDDKYTDNFHPPSSSASAQNFQAPDPYAEPEPVMPAAMPASYRNSASSHSRTPPPPDDDDDAAPPPTPTNAANYENSYEVQVEVKYQPQDNVRDVDRGVPNHRDRGYSTPESYEHHHRHHPPTQRSYEDYDSYHGYQGPSTAPGQMNPPQMNYSQTLPRGDSRGHYYQDLNRYDPRDPRSNDPRIVDPRSNDPRIVDPRNNDPRIADPRNFDNRNVDTKSVDPRSRETRRQDPRGDPSFDPRMDPRYDPRMDPRMDPRDPRNTSPRDTRNPDPRSDPRMTDPRMSDPRYQEYSNPNNYSQTLPNRKGRAAPDPYENQYQPPRRTFDDNYNEVVPMSPYSQYRATQAMPPRQSSLGQAPNRAGPGGALRRGDFSSFDDTYATVVHRQPYPQQPYSDQPNTQRPYSEQPYPRELYSDQPNPHRPNSEQPYPRESYSEPPYPRQSYSEQSKSPNRKRHEFRKQPSVRPHPVDYAPKKGKGQEQGGTLRRSGEHGSQASLGSVDSGGSASMRRQRKARQPYYRALYDYQAADDDEISFNEGDAIVDVVPIDQGWMEGRVKRTGEYGMLPANYVELVQ